MGLFDFSSTVASELWRQIDSFFPEGKWVDVTLKRKPVKAWSKAYDKLLSASNSFAGDPSYTKNAAAQARKSIEAALELWADPNQRREDVARAMADNMQRLMKALPDLSGLRKDPNAPAGVPDAIESFMDSSLSTLKNMTVVVENARRRSDNAAPKPDKDPFEEVADTLALMKFRDTALTMKQWTGDLPTALRLAADEAPGKYFKYMADNIPGVADRSPKANDLKTSVDDLEDFVKAMKDPTQRATKLAQLTKATGMLETLGSRLVSGKAGADERKNTAWETMVYLDCLNDVFGVRRSGDQKVGYAKLDLRKVQQFEELAETSVREIDRNKLKERWEPRKLEK